MKIICPHCQGVASVDDGMISEKGTRARCPRCGRRIIVKRKPAAASGKEQARPPAAAPVSTAPAGPVSSRPTSSKPSERAAVPESESARLLRRVEQRREARRQEVLQSGIQPEEDQDIQFEDELADVSVEVTLAMDPQRVFIGAAVFLVIALAAVWWWSKRLEADMPRFAPPVDQSLRGAGALYGGPDLEALVHRMRLKIRRDDYRAFAPPLDSPEVRVMNEVLKNCGTVCPELVEAGLAPLETRDGVFAELTCDGGTRYRLTYYWTTNSAWIDDKQCP